MQRGCFRSPFLFMPWVKLTLALLIILWYNISKDQLEEGASSNIGYKRNTKSFRIYR